MRSFDEVLATVPHSKTFEVNGTQRVRVFTQDDRISAAREIIQRERDASRKPRRTAKMVIQRFSALAYRLERQAAGIRGRVPSASSSSQNIMRAEAAAIERSVRAIRQQIEDLGA